MKTKIVMAGLMLGLVAMAGAAQAENHRERPGFATLDTDGDGFLSMDELQARGAARFADADTDGDGALSEAELIAAANARATERAAEMIARMDDNGDGLLQSDEMRPRGGNMAARMFTRADTDGDGLISEAEFQAAMAHLRERRGHGPRDRG